MIPQVAMIIALAGSPSVSVTDPGVPAEKTTAWKQVEESGSITLYERWVKVDEYLEVRERKGVFTANCPAERAVEYISNAEMAPVWMKGVSECRVIKRNSEADWYAYTFYTIPWPFSDRDLVSRYRVTFDPASGSTCIRMNSEERLIPEKDGVERIVKFSGSWDIQRLNGHSCRITFTARTDTPPAYPRWLQDPVVKKAFMSNLENLRAALIGPPGPTP